jgi:hypothetical protein
MSNWSSVILCWSGIDDKVEGKEGTDTRLAEIDRLWTDKIGPKKWIVSYSCERDVSIAVCCEVVAITHANHFGCEDEDGSLVHAIQSLEWQYPNEVQLFWKSEDHNSYLTCKPFSYLDFPRPSAATPTGQTLWPTLPSLLQQ